jgi:glucosamine kinase
MPEPLYIGIDGGGTNCRARIRDAAGCLLGEGVGGPANLGLGADQVMRSIMDAVRAAGGERFSEAGLHRAHAGFALAGTEFPGASRALLALPHPFASVVVDSDSYGALLGACGPGDGAILILGTGSAGLAVVGGKRIRVGGYGAAISDEASGQWLGREAIRRALWAHDGRAKETALATAILAHFDRDPDEVVAFAGKAKSADFARFAPLVLEHARSDDPLALALVHEAAADAAKIIDTLIGFGAPSVALLGGLATPLGAWLPESVRKRLSEPKGDALEGAILMARRSAEAPSARKELRA